MSEWRPPPDPLPPLGAAVHVWCVALDDPACDVESLHTRLSPDEQERAAKFRFSRDRRRYVIAHAALRDILSRYLLSEPQGLQFSSGENGKPRLAPPFHNSAIEFNLSHSQEQALLAVNREHEIGVDLEYVNADFNVFDVAQRFFTDAEVAALRRLPVALQFRGFYKCWTSKEAFLKAKGTGLSGKLDEVRISLLDEEVRVHAAVAGWALTELSISDGYEGALVTRNRPPAVLYFRWRSA